MQCHELVLVFQKWLTTLRKWMSRFQKRGSLRRLFKINLWGLICSELGKATRGWGRRQTWINKDFHFSDFSFVKFEGFWLLNRKKTHHFLIQLPSWSWNSWFLCYSSVEWKGLFISILLTCCQSHVRLCIN